MLGLFRNERDAAAERYYKMILAQARQPTLFIDHGVPDTIEGRYDMMVLHAFLVVNRLGREAGEAHALAQEVCNRFFAEQDRAFREMGVGDLAVPKRMKSIAELYAGCSAAYAAGLAEAEDAGLIKALARNVYDDSLGTDPRAAPLAAYVRVAAAALAAAPLDLAGKSDLPFPSPAMPGRSAA